MTQIGKDSNKKFKNVNFSCITVSRNLTANKTLKEILLEEKISFEENEDVQFSNANKHVE